MCKHVAVLLMHLDMWMLLHTDFVHVFSLSPHSSPLFYLLFLSVSFIMTRGKLEIKKASIGRQSEWSHSVMLSAIHNALQVESWHILYIFPLWRSLTKCLLMYSSQEMNFYLREPERCSLSLPSVWSLGFNNIQEIHVRKHTRSPETEITNKYRCHVHAEALPAGGWSCSCWYEQLVTVEPPTCTVKQWSKCDCSDILYE